MPGAREFRSDFDLDAAAGDPAFKVDLDGFEGPLDLLLELARRQKVDLARISVLALAEQYLLFIEAARKLRLELAADYLVMAAWLAFLKSRLLLPSPLQAAEPDASELADALAQRLRKLEAIRKAAKLLENRPQLGRDFFARARPRRSRSPAAPSTKPIFTISLRPTPVRRRSTPGLGCASRRARSGPLRMRGRPWRGWSEANATGPHSTIGFSRPALIQGCAGAPAPPPSPRRSNWCARARSNSGRKRPSRRSGSAPRRSRPPTASPREPYPSERQTR